MAAMRNRSARSRRKLFQNLLLVLILWSIVRIAKTHGCRQAERPADEHQKNKYWQEDLNWLDVCFSQDALPQ